MLTISRMAAFRPNYDRRAHAHRTRSCFLNQRLAAHFFMHKKLNHNFTTFYGSYFVLEPCYAKID